MYNLIAQEAVKSRTEVESPGPSEKAEDITVGTTACGPYELGLLLVALVGLEGQFHLVPELCSLELVPAGQLGVPPVVLLVSGGIDKVVNIIKNMRPKSQWCLRDQQVSAEEACAICSHNVD